ncbi:hypothetical protein ACLI4Q_06335 [Natrialbaceae archaeon A-CW1-1]
MTDVGIGGIFNDVLVAVPELDYNWVGVYYSAPHLGLLVGEGVWMFLEVARTRIIIGFGSWFEGTLKDEEPEESPQ